MRSIIEKPIWLEHWESDKPYNVEVGFKEGALLRGYISKNIFSNFEQLPNVDYFIELKDLKAKCYEKDELIYGEIACYIGEKKYKVIYYYDRDYYLVTDNNDKIIKKIGNAD